MTQKRGEVKRLFVVDADSSGYAHLLATAKHWQVVQFRSGREALRTNPEESPTMWVIHIRLPDLTGTMLHEMLRLRGCNVPIALIGDEYNVEDELRARLSGVSMYLTKPLSFDFLEATYCGEFANRR